MSFISYLQNSSYKGQRYKKNDPAEPQTSNLKPQTLKIDIHTHIMPEQMPNWTQKFGYGEFIHLEHRNCEACMMKGDKLFRVVEENCFKEDMRIKEMDETECKHTGAFNYSCSF